MNTNKLIVIHNFIADEDVKIINEHLVNTPLSKIKYKKDVLIENKASNHNKKSKVSYKLPSSWVNPCDNQLVYELIDAFIPLIKDEIEVSFNASVCPENSYSINAYIVGDQLPEHDDSEGLAPTPNGNPKRDISSILYLNADFEGGEVSFPNQGVGLRPKPGMLILFPSTPEFSHSVGIVDSGVRYCIPQFWSIKRT